MTFPYRTTSANHVTFMFAAINNLSEHNLVAPYKLIGAAALSVLSATRRLTDVSKQA